MECVEVLLRNGARVYDCDEWGVYPIHTCVAAYGDFNDALKILDILLEAGAPTDINLRDGEYGKLPLHYAAFYGNKRMCERLLELGVDINAKDKHGRTAYQSSERQKKIQEFLKSKGCEIPEPIKKSFPPLFPLFAVKNTTSNNSEGSSSDSSATDDALPQITTVTADCHPINNVEQPMTIADTSTNDV